MIILFVSHHFLNNSLVVCEEHPKVAAHNKEDARTVNFGVSVHTVAGDSVMTGAGQVMESGDVPSLAVVSCSVIVAVLLPFSY